MGSYLWQCVKWLVARGAKPNARDRFGGSALLDALKGNHTEIMAFLTTHGASTLMLWMSPHHRPISPPSSTEPTVCHLPTVLEFSDPGCELCQAVKEGDVARLQKYLELGKPEVPPDETVAA